MLSTFGKCLLSKFTFIRFPLNTHACTHVHIGVYTRVHCWKPGELERESEPLVRAFAFVYLLRALCDIICSQFRPAVWFLKADIQSARDRDAQGSSEVVVKPASQFLQSLISKVHAGACSPIQQELHTA